MEAEPDDGPFIEKVDPTDADDGKFEAINEVVEVIVLSCVEF